MGTLMGSCLNHKLGLINQADINVSLNFFGWCKVLLHTAFGMLMLWATKNLFKFIFKYILCFIFNLDRTNPDALRKKRIELPLYYFTYFLVGINGTLTLPYIIHSLGV